MRAVWIAVLAVAVAGCERERHVESGPSEVVVSDRNTGAPAHPEICVEDAREALSRRLIIERGLVDDALAGAMSARMANANIGEHSDRSLIDGLARYAEGAVALVAHAGDQESCSWLISSRGVVAYGRTGIGREQIRADVERVIAALGVTGAMRSRSPENREGELVAPAPLAVGELRSALARVAETVTPPAVADWLSSFDSIIVVPHQAIAAFPMMLLTEESAGGEVRYIIDRPNRTIQVAPSLADIGIGDGLHRNFDAVLANMSQSAREAALSDALIVGDPRYEAFVQLNGAYNEAIGIAGMFGAEALLRERATNAEVRARLRSRPSYIHFATHGVADIEGVDDNQGFLALAGRDRLTIADVRDVGGFAGGSIVVLSACQTALGASRPGGLVGLPRAFLNEGAQTVVMSLWNVGDAATDFLMQRFAIHLRATGRPVAAFSEAVRETKKRFPDPRHWGSFEVFSVGRS